MQECGLYGKLTHTVHNKVVQGCWTLPRLPSACNPVFDFHVEDLEAQPQPRQRVCDLGGLGLHLCFFANEAVLLASSVNDLQHALVRVHN